MLLYILLGVLLICISQMLFCYQSIFLRITALFHPLGLLILRFCSAQARLIVAGRLRLTFQREELILSFEAFAHEKPFLLLSFFSPTHLLIHFAPFFFFFSICSLFLKTKACKAQSSIIIDQMSNEWFGLQLNNMFNS